MKTRARRRLAAFLPGICALGCVSGVAAQAADNGQSETALAIAAATTPAPRSDRNSALAHADLVAKAAGGVIDVYFVGDSITRRWGALDYPDLLRHFERSFFGWNAANFGWGGDQTQHILWRLANGELYGAMPAVFVVQAGTNNLSPDAAAEVQTAAIAAGIEAIVRLCREQVPAAKVILTAVFPRRDRPQYNATINAINERIARLAADESVRFVNINDALADSQGLISRAMSDDGLHLSLDGYEVWAGALEPVLREILGPPAATDAAPAPTGNPAVLRP